MASADSSQSPDDPLDLREGTGRDVPVARYAADDGPEPPHRRRVRPRPPEPGLLMSIVWCLGFLAVLYGSTVIFGLGTFVVLGAMSPQPAESLREEVKKARAWAAYMQANPKPEGDPVPVPENVSYGIAGGTAAGHIATLAYTLILLRFVIGRDWPRLIALRRPSAAQVIVAVLIMPGLMLVHSGVHEMLNYSFGADPTETQENLKAVFGPWPVWLGILLIGVGPGIIEELYCRGFLAHGLVGRFGYPVGVLLTSAFFGILHVEPLYAVGTAVMGVFLHLTYLLTRSLWIPILIHFGNNSVGITAILTANDEGGDSTASYVCAVLLTIVGFATLWTCRARLAARSPDETPGRPPYPGVAWPPEGSRTIVRSPLPNIVLFILTCGLFAALIYSFT